MKRLLTNHAAPKIEYEVLSLTLNIRKANRPYNEIVSSGKYLRITESANPVTSLSALAKYKKRGQL
jgi:hypothetical protein